MGSYWDDHEAWLDTCYGVSVGIFRLIGSYWASRRPDALALCSDAEALDALGSISLSELSRRCVAEGVGVTEASLPSVLYRMGFTLRELPGGLAFGDGSLNLSPLLSAWILASVCPTVPFSCSFQVRHALDGLDAKADASELDAVARERILSPGYAPCGASERPPRRGLPRGPSGRAGALRGPL